MTKISKGILCLGPPILVTTAFILSIFANTRCNFVKVADQQDGILGWFLDQITPKSMGLWCFEAPNGETVDTRDEEFDDKFMAARALGTTVLCLGLIIWIISVLGTIKCFPSVLILLNGFLCVCTSLFQGLVFLIFKSDICETLTCSMDTGGNCGAGAVAVWLVAGIVSFAWGQEE